MPKLLVIAAACAISLGAVAAPVIDQTHSDTSEAISSLRHPLVQSFQPGATNIVGAGVFLGNLPGASATVNVSLWTALPTAAGATQLASAAGTGASGGWLDVFFSAVSVTPDISYFLEFEATVPSGIAIMGSTQGTYSRGQVFADPGTGTFSSFPAYDYAFRTWTEPATTAQVPEPPSLALAGLALFAIAAARRRIRV